MVDITTLIIALVSVTLVCGTLLACYIIHVINKNKRHNADLRLQREIELSKIQGKIDIRQMELKANQPKPVEVKDPEKRVPDKATEAEIKAWHDLLADPFKLIDDENKEQGGE